LLLDLWYGHHSEGHHHGLCLLWWLLRHVCPRYRLGLYPPQLGGWPASDGARRGGCHQGARHHGQLGQLWLGQGGDHVGVHHWQTGPWLPWLSILFSLALTLAVLSIVPCQLGHLLTVKRISILLCQELRPSLVLLIELLVPLQLLTSLIPGACSLDLKCMNVGSYWLYMMFLHQSALMKPSKEPNLYLTLCILLGPHHLGRPVREALLLGVHDIVERAARLGKPVLVTPGVSISVAVPTGRHLAQVVDAVSEHLPGSVRHGAVHPVVDNHVVHDVLHIRLILLQYPVLVGLALRQHLLQVYVPFQQEFCSPLLLTKTGKCFSVR